MIFSPQGHDLWSPRVFGWCGGAMIFMSMIFKSLWSMTFWCHDLIFSSRGFSGVGNLNLSSKFSQEARIVCDLKLSADDCDTLWPRESSLVGPHFPFLIFTTFSTFTTFFSTFSPTLSFFSHNWSSNTPFQHNLYILHSKFPKKKIPLQQLCTPKTIIVILGSILVLKNIKVSHTSYMYTFVIVEYDIHQFIIHINISKLSENPEHYSDIKNLLPEIRKRICTKEHLRVRMAFVHSNSFFNTQKAKVFMPNGFNYGVTDGNLVRFRCIMPMPHTIQTDNYPPRFIGGFLLITYWK